MRRILILMVAVAAMVLFNMGAAYGAEAPNGKPVVDGSLIVSYADEDVTSKEVNADAASVDGQFVQAIPVVDAAILEDVAKPEEAIEELEAQKQIASVDYDYLVEPTFAPNDPYYATRGIQAELDTMRFPSAFDTTRGGVKVGVVDSGCYQGHPDLTGKTIAGYDWVNNNSTVEDTMGHGTHVTGSVAAQTNSGDGMAAGGFNTKVICEKVFGGEGSTASTSDIISGIDHAVDNGAKVVNLSLSGGGYVTAFQDLIKRVDASGVVVVAAAGNDGQYLDARYPASYDEVVGVAATDYRTNHASYSNRGPFVDIAAVGSEILSTTNDGGYGYKNGTSMATPQVAAEMALIRQTHPGATSDGIKRHAFKTARDLGPAGYDTTFGRGMIDAGAAVRY